MLTNLSLQSGLPLEEIFENLQIIYSGGLQELIRQISIQCIERGELMQKIWNAYVSLFERIILQQRKFSNEVEKNYLSETSRIHKVYQAEIENYKNKLEIETKEKEQTKKDLEKLLEKHHQLKIKYKKLLGTFSTQKQNFDNMRAEFNLIQEENLNLKINLERLSKTKELDKSDILIRKLPMRKIGSFVEKNIATEVSLKKIDDTDRENIEEESMEIIMKDACQDTADLIVRHEIDIQTTFDNNTPRSPRTSKVASEKNLRKEITFEIPMANFNNIGTQTFDEDFMNQINKVSVLGGKKKMKVKTEVEIVEKETPLKKTQTTIDFNKHIKDIDKELETEENGLKKNIRFIDMINERCIGSLISDDLTPSPLRNHLEEFRNNIKKTTTSLHNNIHSILEENQDQKIDILEKDNDIENKDDEIRRKDQEIEYLKANVSSNSYLN